MRRLAAALFTVLALAGCANGDQTAGESPSPAGQTPNPDIKPTVQITFPEKGEEAPGPDVIVAITVTSFNVVDKLGEDPADGEGHVHFYLDVDELPTDPGKPAVTDDDKTYHAAAKTSHTWEGVKAGEHTFAVQLVNNDHTPLEPPVTDEVTVEVREA